MKIYEGAANISHEMEIVMKKEKTLINTLFVLIVIFIGILAFMVIPFLQNMQKAAPVLEKAKFQKLISKELKEQAGFPVHLEAIVVKKDGSATKPTQANQDYIIPDSSSRLLSANDVSSLTKGQLALARNEILARHGRIFVDKKFKNYFESKSWYQGMVQPDVFDANMDARISATENSNITLIKSYE